MSSLASGRYRRLKVESFRGREHTPLPTARFIERCCPRERRGRAPGFLPEKQGRAVYLHGVVGVLIVEDECLLDELVVALQLVDLWLIVDDALFVLPQVAELVLQGAVHLNGDPPDLLLIRRRCLVIPPYSELLGQGPVPLVTSLLASTLALKRLALATLSRKRYLARTFLGREAASYTYTQPSPFNLC